MRNLEWMLKATKIFASGPNENGAEDGASNFDAEQEEAFISRNEMEKEFLWVAWFQEETGICHQLGKKLPDSETLTAEWRGTQFWINLNDAQHCIPLAANAHNTYILLSSIAHLLRDQFDFWLVKHLMEDDLHALLITSKQESALLAKNHSGDLEKYFSLFSPGHDHFSRIKIPYTDNENNNPYFENQQKAIAPFISNLTETIAQKGAQLLDYQKQHFSWLNKLSKIEDPQNFNVDDIIKKSMEFELTNAQIDEIFDRKITKLRDEIELKIKDTA